MLPEDVRDVIKQCGGEEGCKALEDKELKAGCWAALNEAWLQLRFPTPQIFDFRDFVVMISVREEAWTREIASPFHL